LPVSILLTVSTLIASYWYVMGQNWFMTLVYADFYGWTYLVLLGVIFLVLLDIGLNRARATGDALHAMTQIIF
jgi:hypothetical protein